MKFDNNLLRKCYYDTMVLQYKRKLESQGFTVFLDHWFYDMQVDLYAEKGPEKKVYVFKLIGNEENVNWNITDFKMKAESYGVTPYVVYVNPPVKKQIRFDDLSVILTDFFINGEMPSKLDSLSTHTHIDSVDVDELTNVEVVNNLFRYDGDALVSVSLHNGSGSDISCDEDSGYSESFPMSFSVKLIYDDDEYTIDDIEYEIDTSNFYA